MKILPLLAATTLIAPAADITVESAPFRVERAFPATLLPAKPGLIAIDPERWAEFAVEEIVPHGAPVKKGDLLAKFDREGFDRKLEDSRRAVQSRALAMASQELAYLKLEEETALKLAAARRTGRVAAEELDYFTKTGRKTQEEQAEDNLVSARHYLEAEQEELKQLRMMYDADDLTEQTEEIILKRQEYAVKSSELNFRHATLSTARTLDVLLPRRAETLEAEAKATTIELEKSEKNLPRGLEAARLDLEAARTTAAREKEELADLEKDAALMEIKAPDDGIFYHGSLDEGRWNLGDLAKSLVKGGRVPLIRPFASLVPANPDLKLVALVDEATARSLKMPLKGGLVAAGREDVALTATIEGIAAIPGTDGKYRIDLLPEWPESDELEWPADLEAAAGMNFECRFVVHQQDACISLPLKALNAAGEGAWAVRVKTADGKGEPRPIVRGRVSGDRVEILEGLENGQVVIVPD